VVFLYVPLTSNNGTAAARRATEKAIANAGSSDSTTLYAIWKISKLKGRQA